MHANLDERFDSARHRGWWPVGGLGGMDCDNGPHCGLKTFVALFLSPTPTQALAFHKERLGHIARIRRHRLELLLELDLEDFCEMSQEERLHSRETRVCRSRQELCEARDWGGGGVGGGGRGGVGGGRGGGRGG